MLLSASNIIGQSISIQGIFPEDGEIGLSIHFHEEKMPSRILYQKIESSLSEQTIIFPLSSKEIVDLWWFRIFTKQQNGSVYLREIKLSNNFKIDASGIKEGLYIYEKTCPNEIELIDGQKYFVFHEGECASIIDSSIFYQSRPINFQLFLRLFFLAILFFFIFIFYKQAPPTIQRFSIFAIALFLATLPFKIDYTNYAMGFMLLTSFLIFVRDTSRRFIWQPIFYIICAMYLLNIIGLSYTNDFKMGIKRLDATVVFIFFPIIFSMIQFPKKNLMLLLRFFVWSVIAFCMFGLMSYATITHEISWNMVFHGSKSYAPLLMMWPAHPHPSYLSTILLMAAPVALYLRFQNGKQISLTEILLAVLLPIVFTILGGARVGMMIVPVLLLLGYLFYCKFRPMLKWGLAVAGIAICVFLIHSFPKVDDRFDDPIRANLRKTAISAIQEKPVFGWGTGSAKLLIQSEERAHNLGIRKPYNFNQFHNQYLEDMVQFGIAGLLLLLVLLGWMLLVSICEKNYLLLSLLAIYAIFFWTESVLFTSKGIVPFTFWFSFLISNKKALLDKN